MYKILITKTHFSSFQLRKFEFPQSSEATMENFIQFLEDVRMKRINPKYKSESIPENKNKKIIKIVGNTFISEIF